MSAAEMMRQAADILADTAAGMRLQSKELEQQALTFDPENFSVQSLLDHSVLMGIIKMSIGMSIDVDPGKGLTVYWHCAGTAHRVCAGDVRQIFFDCGDSTLSGAYRAVISKIIAESCGPTMTPAELQAVVDAIFAKNTPETPAVDYGDPLPAF